jgi:peptidoglycan hydrolase-like protein with peptidoglycan-binding domain
VTRQTSPGRYEWRGILCETNTTVDRVKQIQTALKSAGFDRGPIDGIVKSETMRAVNAFQQNRNLPVDQYLNIETVRALGVSPN